jgi:large-conductance mechanosensitive channel
VEPQVSKVLEIQRLRTRGETIMKADYINMMINFSILALLIYLAVQVHDLRNPPKHQPAMMGYDNSLELRYNIQEFLNNALKQAINQQETQ